MSKEIFPKEREFNLPDNMTFNGDNVEVDLSQYKKMFDRVRRCTYMYFLSPQLWYRQQRGLCSQNYRNWQKCIQQKGEEHVYCTYYRALSEGGCGRKFILMVLGTVGMVWQGSICLVNIFNNLPKDWDPWEVGSKVHIYTKGNKKHNSFTILLERWDEQIPFIQDYGSFEDFTNRW